TDEDLSPNRKFVDNEVIQLIEANNKLRLASEDRKVNWVGDEHQEMFRKMFLHIRESETYFEHMNNGQTGFEADKAFVLDLFKIEVANFPLLYNFFEEKSIHWLDDIDLSCSMVLKTIKNFEAGSDAEILDLFKDPED